MSINEIYKQSFESNIIDLQTNEANAMQELKTRTKAIIRIVPKIIDPPRKIKYFYSDLESYNRRPSQKPNYAFEKKTDTIKVDTAQLQDTYITKVQKIDKMSGPREFDDVYEKNILNMPPILEREFTPSIIRTFNKLDKNNELNFIQNKVTNREIEIPITPVASSKTIIKRM